MDTDQLLRAGAEHAGAKHYVEAERCLREALDCDAGNPYVLNTLGVVLHEQGRLEEACGVLAQAIERAPEMSEPHFNLGRVYLELDQLDLALGCFEEVLCRVHSDADTFAAIATALERRGEFGEAEEYFAEAAQFSQKYVVTRMLRFSGDFLHGIEAAARPATLPPVVLGSTSGRHELVALVTCDPGYLRKYGAAFANSFMHHADPGALLHLHVLDPEAGTAAEAGDLLKRTGVARYCVSAGHGSRHAAGSRGRSVWYTCARLIHLEAWLRAYEAPIVVLDADAAIQAPPGQLVDAVRDGDIGLLLRDPRRAPWLDVMAGGLVARPTPAALGYLRLVAAYAEHFLAHDAPQWHLDQCALYCVLRMLQAEGRAPDYRRITDAFNATVFHLGHMYDERMADARYARYLPAR